MNGPRLHTALDQALVQWRKRENQTYDEALRTERHTWKRYADKLSELLLLINQINEIASKPPSPALLDALQKEAPCAHNQAKFYEANRRPGRDREFLTAAFLAWFREGGPAACWITNPVSQVHQESETVVEREPRGPLITYICTVSSEILGQPLSAYTARTYIRRFGKVCYPGDLTVGSPEIGAPTLQAYSSTE
jgi:hypothetical protein